MPSEVPFGRRFHCPFGPLEETLGLTHSIAMDLQRMAIDGQVLHREALHKGARCLQSISPPPLNAYVPWLHPSLRTDLKPGKLGTALQKWQILPLNFSPSLPAKLIPHSVGILCESILRNVRTHAI